MPHRTDIEWADYSSNPLRARFNGKQGWSCAMVSPGCKNCYSKVLNGRFGNQLDYTVANTRAAEHYVDGKELRHIVTFRHKAPYKNGRTRPTVFPFDMTDVFGDWVSDAILDGLFAAFALRPDVDFLILTKRPERMAEYVTAIGRHSLVDDRILGWHANQESTDYRASNALPVHPLGVAEKVRFREWWPLPNVWLGTSVEDQQRADERVPHLLRCPAAVRFLSCEPLLGPINLHLSSTGIQHLDDFGAVDADGNVWLDQANWVIVGGESGHGARACNIAWIRSIIEQCKAAGVPIFCKQLGSRPIDSDALRLALVTSNRHGRLLRDAKGGDPTEWAEDLRVRQFPRTATANL